MSQYFRLHPEVLNRQRINLSSVTYKRAVWGVFWDTTNSEMWMCKIMLVGYCVPKFMSNKMKKELSPCLS